MKDFEQTLRWDDPTLGINWPLKLTKISEKDGSAPNLSSISKWER
jgi:dTDP-4-dehydrorhamnose 3,5-epimerase-like enzyme